MHCALFIGVGGNWTEMPRGLPLAHDNTRYICGNDYKHVYTRHARVYGLLGLMHSATAICIHPLVLYKIVATQHIIIYVMLLAVMSSRVTIHVAIISSRVKILADISNNVSVCACHAVGCHVVWDVRIYMFCVL